MTNPTKLEENKMGTMPVRKLLITMSLPMILSMIVQALYNIVDSVFVAQLGEEALNAVAMAFPIQNLIIAVAVGTGVGINALLSRSLGEKNQSDVNASANNGLFLTLISYIVFALLGLFFSRFFFEIQTNNPAVINYGTDYMWVCTVFSFGVFFQITFDRLLQSTGRTFYNMITQGSGAIINIILDPILIFGLFGFPRLEVAGAAIATVIGQIAAMLLGLYFNHKVNKDIQIRIKDFRPSARIIKAIYRVGIPSMVMQSIGSVMVFLYNQILISFSETAVSVFGIYFRLQSFIFMPVFGLSNGLIPIVAFNYGAKQKKRIMDSIQFSIMIAVGIMLVGLMIFQFFPQHLLAIFNATDQMQSIGIPALRIVSSGFLFAGYCIMISSVFQALGNGGYSMFISIVRQLIVLLPAAFVLAHLLGLHSTWYSFLLSEIASLILCTLLFRRTYVNKIKDLES